MKNKVMCRAAVALSFVLTVTSHADDHLAAPADGWIRVNDDAPAVSYSSDVAKFSDPEYFDQDMHASQKRGAWCKFSFNGTGVK
jgi:hypothetical protein